ncbi:MAG: biotin--[Ruminococcus sp.]|nr:biotin--[acetyl-CoA-carboxylase] ligase [Ruminococcus sp.]
MMLSAENISTKLNCNAQVLCFDTIDSTNSEAKRNSHKLTDSPLLFVANSQTAGRGRLGRSFYSPKDTGLYMSLMLKAKDDIQDTVCMTTAVSVCVTDAIKALCGIDAVIKWVNDIYIGSKKVCGILCEAVTDYVTSKIKGIIIGIGINISTIDFPDELRDIASSLGQAVDKNHLCALITDNIVTMYENIESRAFIDEYKKRSLVLGKKINYTENGVTKEATAVDIDNNGGLIIETENGTKTLSTGEITIRIKNDKS